MTGVFDDITITWSGKSYFIPAHRVLPALARVEEAITLHELQQFQARGTVPLVRLSQAYGAVLRFAGCSADDDDVYLAVLDNKLEVGQAVTAILLMFLPKEMRDVIGPGEDAGNALPAAVSSSKKRTRQRSGS